MLKFEKYGTKGMFEVLFGEFRIGYIYPMGLFQDNKMTLQFDAPKMINKDPSNRLHPEILNISNMSDAKKFFEMKSEGLTLEKAY